MINGMKQFIPKAKMKPNKSIRMDGIFCTLIPIMEKDLPLVVELRNKEKNKYYMNQKYDITLEMQKEWYQKYMERDDDIYWGIWNKAGCFIGTIRLYHIEKDVCEEGSCIVDERYAKDAPYAVETKYILAQYAFQTLGIHQMVNEIRIDNKAMYSLARQQGYQIVKQVDIGGEQYHYMILDADQFAGKKIKKYWITGKSGRNKKRINERNHFSGRFRHMPVSSDINTSKQPLPVYDKPMINYLFSLLMLTGIREI